MIPKFRARQEKHFWEKFRVKKRLSKSEEAVGEPTTKHCLCNFVYFQQAKGHIPAHVLMIPKFRARQEKHFWEKFRVKKHLSESEEAVGEPTMKHCMCNFVYFQ